MSILGQISYVLSTAHYQIIYLTESVDLNGGDVYRATDTASRRAVTLTSCFFKTHCLYDGPICPRSCLNDK